MHGSSAIGLLQLHHPTFHPLRLWPGPLVSSMLAQAVLIVQKARPKFRIPLDRFAGAACTDPGHLVML
jgi:hypothetical protein